jgi:hypothetical protein
MTPVVEANSRKTAAGAPTQRCHRRKNRAYVSFAVDDLDGGASLVSTSFMCTRDSFSLVDCTVEFGTRLMYYEA